MTPFKLLLTLLFAAVTLPAFAQPVGPPPKSIQSMEWRVLGASLVVAGEVAGLEEISIPQDPTRHFRVAFRATETIKGELPEDFHFVVRLEYYDKDQEPRLRAWAEKKSPLLLFLTDSRAAALRGIAPRYASATGQWLHLREPYALVSPQFDQCVIELDPANTELRSLTADFRPLVKPAEILEAARSSAKSEPETPTTLPLGIIIWHERFKGSAVDKYTADRNAIALTVPVDERIERIGRAWLESPDPAFREQGIEYLVYFPSRRNAVLLRELTSDKDPGVAKAAQITLHCWGLRKEDILPPKKFGDD